MAALERLISEIGPSLGLNWLILHVNGHFQYTSHPEAAEPDGIDAEEARRLAGWLKQEGEHQAVHRGGVPRCDGEDARLRRDDMGRLKRRGAGTRRRAS